MNQIETPEQLAEQGKALYERQDYFGAADLFGKAGSGHLAAGDALSAVEMDNNRSVALLMAGDFRGALEAAGETASVFGLAGDTRRQAMALGNRAAALEKLGKTEEAESLYWESARLLGEIGEKDLRASVLQSISKLQVRKGRYVEAISSMEGGLEGAEKLSFTQRLLKRLIRFANRLLNR